MKSKLRKALLVLCIVGISPSAIATDDGTWHGDGFVVASSVMSIWLSSIFSELFN